jgi:hypothetical protein
MKANALVVGQRKKYFNQIHRGVSPNLDGACHRTRTLYCDLKYPCGYDSPPWESDIAFVGPSSASLATLPQAGRAPLLKQLAQTRANGYGS